MKFRRLSPWILLPAFLATCAFSFVAKQDGGVLLRRTLKEGESHAYKIAYKSTQLVEMPNGAGEQQITVNGSQDYTETIGKVDASGKSGAVAYKTSNIKIDMDSPMGNPMQSQDMPKEIVMNGSIDERNRVSDLKTTTTLPGISAGDFGSSSAYGTFVAFPEGPVKIGDSWTMDYPKMAFTPGARLNAKLTGESVVDGVPVWIVNVTGTVPMDMDLGALLKDSNSPLAGQEMRLTGSMDLDVELDLEKSDDVIFSATTKSKSKNVMSLPQMGIDVNMSGDVTVTMKRA